MSSSRDLQSAAAQLAAFQSEKDQHNSTLSKILEDYASLMKRHERLQSDFEEERDSRERYKQMAKGAERNPFVLVLVDGDGFVFEDAAGGSDGGERAAQGINEAVKRSLSRRGLDHCRIMVRVYANLAGLSKAFARSKLAGGEARSLAPFVASFNRSIDLFDFVDAGEFKEDADFKIRALFRQFVENSQCRHIFCAFGHDTGYLSEITQYKGNRDRITLVGAPNLHPHFHNLGLRVEEFPHVFRTTPLESESLTKLTAIMATAPSPPKPTAIKTTATSPPPSQSKTTQLCEHFKRGKCVYGKRCFKSHDLYDDSAGIFDFRPKDDVKNWRPGALTGQSTLPSRKAPMSKKDSDFFLPNHIPVSSEGRVGLLPEAGSIPSNLIPVNANQHRIDPYVPPPSAGVKSDFHAQVAHHKLCNRHLLENGCPNGESCGFSHHPVSAGVLNYLLLMARSLPCKRKGSCRLINCSSGHVCQRGNCKSRGGKSFCKLGHAAHAQDLKIAHYAAATMPEAPEGKFNDSKRSTSDQGSTPRVPSSYSPHSSEGEKEDEDEDECALLAFTENGDDQR